MLWPQAYMQIQHLGAINSSGICTRVYCFASICICKCTLYLLNCCPCCSAGWLGQGKAGGLGARHSEAFCNLAHTCCPFCSADLKQSGAMQALVVQWQSSGTLLVQWNAPASSHTALDQPRARKVAVPAATLPDSDHSSWLFLLLLPAVLQVSLKDFKEQGYSLAWLTGRLSGHSPKVSTLLGLSVAAAAFKQLPTITWQPVPFPGKRDGRLSINRVP